MLSTTIKNSHILLVDRASESINLISTILQKEGYQVRCSNSSSTALKLAKSKWPELILLNSKITEIDEFELCQQLKSDNITKNIPVIVLGDFQEAFKRLPVLQVGGVDFITEPFQAIEILMRVKNQLAIQQAEAKINHINQEWSNKIQERTVELETANQKLQQEIHSRQQAQDRLLKLALNDSVTGLPNRKSFIARLKQALTKINEQPAYRFAILLLNCDHFREIKCYLGHLASNQLIVEISHRLGNCLPNSMMLSRFEDNSFAIFLDDIKNQQDANNLAQKIQKQFQSSFSISGPVPEVTIAQKDICISCCIGIVIAHNKYQTEYDILQDAEIALYQAEKSEQSIYQIVQAEISSQPYTKIIAEEFHKKQTFKKLAIELQEAFRKKEFKVYYQPILALANSKIIGVEALLRWLHRDQHKLALRDRVLLLPKDFLSVAEQSSLTIALSDLLLHYGTNQLKSLHQDHESQKDFVLTIKLSAKQLLQPKLLEKVKKFLKQSNLSSKYLRFDIDEAILVANKTRVTQVLTELNIVGIKFTWDNFGAQANSSKLTDSYYPPMEVRGKSSLAWLVDNLPHFLFDNVKIASSLVKRLEDKSSRDETKLKIKEIVTIAHENNLKVMAAGIKTQEQLEQLQSLGCDYGQGDLFSKPLTNRALEDLLVWRT